jgi:hypothetical protein
MIKIFKITIIWFMALITLFFACSKKKPNKPEPPKYKWTILGYFDGNNSQDQAPDGHSYVIKDVQELEKIDSTEDVQILVMLGSFKTDGNCKYYHVQRNPDEPQDSISSEVLDTLGKKDMSDRMTLRDFLGFGMQKYPAEHYMLIINDHGKGWKGLCYDTLTNPDGNWMSLPDFSFALSGFWFDIIWFYTPSMATVEAAYQIKDRGKYMIASQFKYRPDNIMGATELGKDIAWLPYLTDDPNRDVEMIARKVTEAIYWAAKKINPDKYVHSALIYLPKITELATDVSNLGSSLIDSTGANWRDVWDAWDASHIAQHSDSVFVDLLQFAWLIQNNPNLDSLIKARSIDVGISGNDAVRVQFKSPDMSNVHGISIHISWNQNDFDSISYAPLDFTKATNWEDFISVFIQTLSNNYAGSLDIRSSPTGAKVFLNNIDTGYETNALIKGLFPGNYTLKLEKTGCQPFIRTDVEIKPQQTTYLPVFYLSCGP